MATKSYALSKKRVREIITEKFGTDTEVNVNDVLALFASAERGSTGESTLVLDDEGNVVGKKCSYFGLYLPISEFGTMGKDEDGNVKYAYQSKAAQKCLREKSKDVEDMKNKIDADLEENGDLDAWRAAKSELAEFEASKCDVPEELIYGETADELLAHL